MDTTAAIACLIGLVDSTPGLVGTTGECPGKLNSRNQVVILDGIVADSYVGGADNENAFIQGVTHCEPGNRDVVQAGIIVAIHKEAVRQIRRIDYRRVRSRTDDCDGKANIDFFIVGTGSHTDGIVGGSVADRIRNG